MSLLIAPLRELFEFKTFPQITNFHMTILPFSYASFMPLLECAAHNTRFIFVKGELTGAKLRGYFIIYTDLRNMDLYRKPLSYNWKPH